MSTLRPDIADFVVAALLCGLSLSLIFAKVKEAEVFDRFGFYFSAAAWTLALFAALIAYWAVNGRPLDRFGLYSWFGEPSRTAALAVGWIAALALAFQLIRRGLFKDQLTRFYRKYEQLMPTNRSELAASWGTSLSAGIGEELVYRGFLMWVAVDVTGLVSGLLLTSLIFGAAHGYQSGIGVMFATGAGLILGGVYIASGSLFLVMLMHATYDIASFRLGMVLLKDHDQAATPVPRLES